MPLPDLEALRAWIGRTETDVDIASVKPAVLLAATLDHEEMPREGDALPATWHWLYFLPAARQRDVGADGHPERGLFLPPVPLRRRMWAGSRIELRRPVRLGSTLQRRTTITEVSGKEGRSGPLVFLRLATEIACEGAVALVETRDIVFRDPPPPGSATPETPDAPDDAMWHEERTSDPVLLFRYSALTFNCHRIHYDWPYATEIERYPGVVVQGPLLATLLADALRRRHADVRPAAITFRALSPLFAGEPFLIAGKPIARGARAWAATPQNRLAMSAEMEAA
jgi:3-methylfumaryl-CoA hydratase